MNASVPGADLRPRLTVVPDLKEQFRLSLILAALENLMKYDDCMVLRAALRARYLDLTDGKAPQ